VLDVSYRYDGVKFFDHHQPDKPLREEGLPYAACGLIWRAFGRDIIASRVDDDGTIEKIFDYVDENLIIGIDFVDNGVANEFDYPIYGVSDIARDFHPVWDSEEDEDAAFDKAVDFAYGVLQRMLEGQYAVSSAAILVKEAYESRAKKEILVLPIGEYAKNGAARCRSLIVKVQTTEGTREGPFLYFRLFSWFFHI
jgi:uncharacterized UPF0160 family protein